MVHNKSTTPFTAFFLISFITQPVKPVLTPGQLHWRHTEYLVGGGVFCKDRVTGRETVFVYKQFVMLLQITCVCAQTASTVTSLTCSVCCKRKRRGPRTTPARPLTAQRKTTAASPMRTPTVTSFSRSWTSNAKVAFCVTSTLSSVARCSAHTRTSWWRAAATSKPSTV